MKTKLILEFPKEYTKVLPPLTMEEFLLGMLKDIVEDIENGKLGITAINDSVKPNENERTIDVLMWKLII